MYEQMQNLRQGRDRRHEDDTEALSRAEYLQPRRTEELCVYKPMHYRLQLVELLSR